MGKLVSLLDEQFLRLNQRSHALILVIPAEKLYWQPRVTTRGFPVYSCGEHVLHCAGAIEQTFGGITANLWDDPFEWTLPETLSSADRVAEYLNEVEATRQRGFERFESDDDLIKEIAVPSGQIQTINALLLDTLVRASHHLGSAFATYRLFSDGRVPGS